MKRLLFACAVGLLTAGPAAAQVDDPKPDPDSVVRYGKGYRYMHGGWTVVHIEGDPYPRGYQHGRLMADEIAAQVKALAAQYGSKAPDEAWRHARTLTDALFVRKFDREFLEEMQGIADGAADAGAKGMNGRKIDLVDVVASNVWMEIETLQSALDTTPKGLEGTTFPRPVPAPTPRPKTLKADHCSAFAATGSATADGKIVFGHITMGALMSGPFVGVWVDVVPTSGQRVCMQAFPGGIWSSQDYYMNGAGILLAETTVDQTPFDVTGMALASRARKAIQYATTIDDVAKHLNDRNNGLYTNEWLVGDINTNEIAMFTLGTHVTALRRSSKDDWYSGTKGFYFGCNNCKDEAVRREALMPGRELRVGPWRASGRDNRWLKLYKDSYGKIDLDWGKKAFTDPILAAPSSLDAKITTSDLAKKLMSVNLYGPPTGKAWNPSGGDKARYGDLIKPLVSNPWTVITADGPPTKE